MGDIFDMNLLTAIHGLGKKFSISKEQPNLKRKTTDNNKHKGRHYNDTKTVKNIDHYDNKNDSFSGEDEGSNINVDITV